MSHVDISCRMRRMRPDIRQPLTASKSMDDERIRTVIKAPCGGYDLRIKLQDYVEYEFITVCRHGSKITSPTPPYSVTALISVKQLKDGRLKNVYLNRQKLPKTIKEALFRNLRERLGEKRGGYRLYLDLDNRHQRFILLNNDVYHDNQSDDKILFNNNELVWPRVSP